jgi:hypothetical protein
VTPGDCHTRVVAQRAELVGVFQQRDRAKPDRVRGCVESSRKQERRERDNHPSSSAERRLLRASTTSTPEPAASSSMSLLTMAAFAATW